MTRPKAFRILLCDEHPVVRERLRELIDAEENFCVCDEAGSAAEALKRIASSSPDLIILGLSLPDRHGLELVRSVRRRSKKMRILIFSLHREELYAARAIRAGAQGYIQKNRPTSEVIAAIRRILGGELYLSSGMLTNVAKQHFAHKQLPNGTTSQMSDRELQVFELMGNGFGCAAIAARLGIKAKTVESFCERLKTKLNLPSIGALRQAAIHALHNGHFRLILTGLLPWISFLTDIDFDLV